VGEATLASAGLSFLDEASVGECLRQCACTPRLEVALLAPLLPRTEQVTDAGEGEQPGVLRAIVEPLLQVILIASRTICGGCQSCLLPFETSPHRRVREPMAKL
jgi:hypothetical protein